MEPLFTGLNHALEGAPLLALVAALAWGVASVVLSPCHLACIPLIVGVLADGHEPSARRALWVSTVFGAGILLTIALVGAVTVALGRLAGDVGVAGNLLAIAIFFAFGLHLLEIWNLPLWERHAGGLGSGARGALALGLVLGTALGPCTFAFMAPVLAASFRSASSAPVLAAGLLAAYGVGHTAVLVAAGASTGTVQAWLDWSEASRGLAMLKKTCGVLLLVGGLYQIYIM